MVAEAEGGIPGHRCEHLHSLRHWFVVNRFVSAGVVDFILLQEAPCGPNDCIQHYTAKVVVGPIFVKMSAGEAEPAPAVRTLNRPGQIWDLRISDPARLDCHSAWENSTAIASQAFSHARTKRPHEIRGNLAIRQSTALSARQQVSKTGMSKTGSVENRKSFPSVHPQQLPLVANIPHCALG
jgi:hypothetical protein